MRRLILMGCFAAVGGCSSGAFSALDGVDAGHEEAKVPDVRPVVMGPEPDAGATVPDAGAGGAAGSGGDVAVDAGTGGTAGEPVTGTGGVGGEPEPKPDAAGGSGGTAGMVDAGTGGSAGEPSMGGAAGMPMAVTDPAAIGRRCAQNADCSGDIVNGYCRAGSFGSPSYCTRNCSGDNQCAGHVCAQGGAFNPGLRCVRRCSSDNDCPGGKCVQSSGRGLVCM